MPSVPGFVGPFSTLRSRNTDVEDTINFYLELNTPGTPKSAATLYGTPGIRPKWILPTAPVRAEFHQDNRAFAIAGPISGASYLYEVFQNGTFVQYGPMLSNVERPTICSNGSAGHQLFITNGGEGYIFDLNTNTLAIIADPGFPHGKAAMGEFMDGYFFVLIKDSRAFQISSLEDGTIWDPLDIAERSEGSDNVLILMRNHREIWLLGSKTSEVWYDNGDPLFPFAPVPGVFLEQGTFSRFGACRLDNTLYWTGENTDGSRMIYRANGYTPERVSSAAIELALTRLVGGLAAAWAFAMQIQGHLTYWLNIDPKFTYVYDVAMPPMPWTKRALWDASQGDWVPHVAGTHMFAFGRHYVGDRYSGAIYEMNIDFVDDQVVVS